MGRVCDYFARRSRRLRIENATPFEKKKRDYPQSVGARLLFFVFARVECGVFPTDRPTAVAFRPHSAVRRNRVTVTIELSFYRFVFATRAPTRSGVRPKTVRNGEHPRGESRTGSVPQSPTVLKKRKQKNNIHREQYCTTTHGRRASCRYTVVSRTRNPHKLR